MSEANTLITPAASTPQADATPAPIAAAPAAVEGVSNETLITPETVQGDAAAAADQGDGEGAATQGGQSEVGEGEGQAEGGEGKDALTGAPETYADFALPENFQLPPELGTELTSLAKELNLPQATAQKLIDMGVKHAQGVAQAYVEQQTATRTQWADATRADAEIGGEQLPAHMATAKKALVSFGTPGLTKVLNDTGLGLHPEFLRLLVRIGGAISEDTIVDTDGGGGDGKSLKVRDHAKSLYPGMK